MKENLKKIEVLSRAQLRKIIGGSEASSNCTGLGDREVCCADDGKKGTCDYLVSKGCKLVVSTSDAKCKEVTGIEPEGLA